jgi:hypothetical protein
MVRESAEEVSRAEKKEAEEKKGEASCADDEGTLHAQGIWSLTKGGDGKKQRQRKWGGRVCIERGLRGGHAETEKCAERANEIDIRKGNKTKQMATHLCPAKSLRTPPPAGSLISHIETLNI